MSKSFNDDQNSASTEPRKLSLSKRTVRQLSATEIAQVAGGDGGTPFTAVTSCGCTFGCTIGCGSLSCPGA